GLAVRAEHDVGRFQIAVEHTSTVSIGNGVADSYEPVKKLPKLQAAFARIVPALGVGIMEPLDRFLQRLALDKAHGIARLAVAAMDEGVHRHDSGVLQACRYFRFQEKALPTLRIVRPIRLDALERDLAA